MAKANLVLPNGTKVNIEGTAEEVAVLISKCSVQEGGGTVRTPKKKRAKRKSSSKTGGGSKKKKEGPTSLITELAEEGYFKSKRKIGDIQKKLEEMGHIYAIESISTPLTRLTRSRAIRRIKENKVWVYVK